MVERNGFYKEWGTLLYYRVRHGARVIPLTCGVGGKIQIWGEGGKR